MIDTRGLQGGHDALQYRYRDLEKMDVTKENLEPVHDVQSSYGDQPRLHGLPRRQVRDYNGLRDEDHHRVVGSGQQFIHNDPDNDWGFMNWRACQVTLLASMFLLDATVARPQGAALPVSKVTVSPLFYVSGGATADGGESAQPYGICEDFELAVGGFPEGQIRIGIIESQLGGAGRLWSATTWQAALTAAQLLDFHPRATQTTLTVRGSIDGPSAGCLLTVGILAAVLDQQLDPTMTMTGTINPDGVIGPVGGIQHKIGGAARAGKKVVLIPARNRFELDRDTGKPVDLVEFGEQQGIEIRLVDDVWTAYREFTGKELPRDPAASAPSLPPRASDHLAKRIDSWLTQATQAHEDYKAMAERGSHPRADASFALSEQSRMRAENNRQQGLYAAAYVDAQYTAIYAWCGYQVGRTEFAYSKGGLEEAKKILEDDAWVVNRTEQASTGLRVFRPATLEQLAVYLHACDTFIAGLCFHQLADVLQDHLPEDEETAGIWLMAAAERQAICWTAMKMAIDELELAVATEGTPLSPDAPYEQLTDLYLRCAEAGQVVVDEILLDQVAQQRGLSKESAKNLLRIVDPAYAINDMGLTFVFPQLEKHFGDNPQQLRFARLAAAIAFHTRSAMLIAKYYSLGAELDEEFSIVGLNREAAFSDWIDDSQDQARRAIGALVNSKIDHTTCVQLYEIGRVNLARDLDDRLSAFEYFFQVNVTAQTLKRLARSP